MSAVMAEFSPVIQSSKHPTPTTPVPGDSLCPQTGGCRGTALTRKTGYMVRSAWAAACAWLLWLGGPGPAVAGDLELLLSCQHDPDDRILTLVCDRV
jgi:hypothetical protein